MTFKRLYRSKLLGRSSRTAVPVMRDAFDHREFEEVRRREADPSSNRFASFSNSPAVRNRASQITGLPASSANTRYQAASSRRRRGSFGRPSLMSIVVIKSSLRHRVCGPDESANGVDAIDDPDPSRAITSLAFPHVGA
jgi:hypothetical protein